MFDEEKNYGIEIFIFFGDKYLVIGLWRLIYNNINKM